MKGLRNLRHWWQHYRYRFVPWIVFNMKDRSIRNVEKSTDDKVIPDSEVLSALENFFQALHSNSQIRPENSTHNGTNFARKTKNYSVANDADNCDSYRVMHNALGFSISKAPSVIPGGGTGVCVRSGRVAKGTLVALYPGAIYFPSEPILFQSINNPFIFRCIDGITVDGNDKGISKFLYRSCAGRDRYGPHEVCDTTWSRPQPRNPMAVGQYVNNHNKVHPPNVAYQEFDLPPEFPLHLRQFVPNVFHSQSNSESARLVRMVALISLREIENGEELFSSYFTTVVK